jgi:protein SCO1/2
VNPAALVTLAFISGGDSAPAPAIPWIGEVRIDQKLDGEVPLDLRFLDADGRRARLGDLLEARPAVLALVYHRCPLLCSQVQRGILSSLRAMSLVADRDFEVIVLSIDPKDGPGIASEARAAMLRGYGRPGSEGGFHFLTGEEPAIVALADAVGFRYRYDPATGQYAHAGGIIVLTPSGRISRYIYGIDYAAGGGEAAYSARDLRLALVEAAGGRIGGLADTVLLLCFEYDPATGKYAIVFDVLRASAVATAAGLALLVFLLSRRARARGARAASGARG